MDATENGNAGTRAIPRDRIAYTVRDAADLLGISPAMIYMLIRDGELSSIKIGRARRVHGSSIEEYARRATVPGQAESS